MHARPMRIPAGSCDVTWGIFREWLLPSSMNARLRGLPWIHLMCPHIWTAWRTFHSSLSNVHGQPWAWVIINSWRSGSGGRPPHSTRSSSLPILQRYLSNLIGSAHVSPYSLSVMVEIYVYIYIINLLLPLLLYLFIYFNFGGRLVEEVILKIGQHGVRGWTIIVVPR